MKSICLGAAIFVLGACLSLAIFFGVDWSAVDADQGKMLHEVFKFSISTILVGGAALIYGTIQSQIENRREDSERELADKMIQERRLEEYLRELTNDYNLTKFIRRELRHELVPEGVDSFHIHASRYQELMRELNKSQLRLEHHRRILAAKPAYLMRISEDALELVSSAENYLRRITAEYEDNILKVANGDDRLFVQPGSALFQYAVSRKNKNHDGSSEKEYFVPLDEFFWAITQRFR